MTRDVDTCAGMVCNERRGPTFESDVVAFATGSARRSAPYLGGVVGFLSSRKVGRRALRFQLGSVGRAGERPTWFGAGREVVRFRLVPLDMWSYFLARGYKRAPRSADVLSMCTLTISSCAVVAG